MVALTVTSMLAVAFAPISLFFRITAPDYSFFKLLNVVILALSAIVGLRFLTGGMRVLNEHGLKYIQDVAQRDPVWLERILGPLGRHLWELSQGRDERSVTPDREAKSIGAEETFEEDLEDRTKLAIHIHAQALRVARRLRAAKLQARVVQLKIKCL